MLKHRVPKAMMLLHQILRNYQEETSPNGLASKHNENHGLDNIIYSYQ